LSDDVIAESVAEATIHAPLAAIDLSGVKVVVTWMFVADEIDSGTTRFTNSVEVRSAPGYLDALEKRGVPFAKASEAAQQALRAHNAEETPLFAKDIEHKALAKRWEVS
jgi:hypothetical protein